jgi:hypothetical protein
MAGMSEFIPAQDVECRSEAAYAERPLAFTWQGQRREVAQVLERWRAPAGKGFRVRTQDGGTFTLLYDEHDDVWQIAEG